MEYSLSFQQVLDFFLMNLEDIIFITFKFYIRIFYHISITIVEEKELNVRTHI